jgi:hypothetical protein
MHTGISRASRALKAIDPEFSQEKTNRPDECGSALPMRSAARARLSPVYGFKTVIPTGRAEGAYSLASQSLTSTSSATSARKGVPPFPCTPEEGLCPSFLQMMLSCLDCRSQIAQCRAVR